MDLDKGALASDLGYNDYEHYPGHTKYLLDYHFIKFASTPFL